MDVKWGKQGKTVSHVGDLESSRSLCLHACHSDDVVDQLVVQAPSPDDRICPPPPPQCADRARAAGVAGLGRSHVATRGAGWSAVACTPSGSS